MITCWGKSCPFGLLCGIAHKQITAFVFLVSVLISLFGFEGGMLDLIVVVPGQCLNIHRFCSVLCKDIFAASDLKI